MISKNKALENWGQLGVNIQDIVNDIYDSIGSCGDCEFYYKKAVCIENNFNTNSDFFCQNFKLRESDETIWSFNEKDGRLNQYKISSYRLNGKNVIGLDGTPAYYDAEDIITDMNSLMREKYDSKKYIGKVPPLVIDLSGKVTGNKMEAVDRLEFYYKAMYDLLESNVIAARKAGLAIEKYIYLTGKYEYVDPKYDIDKSILDLYRVKKQWR